MTLFINLDGSIWSKKIWSNLISREFQMWKLFVYFSMSSIYWQSLKVIVPVLWTWNQYHFEFSKPVGSLEKKRRRKIWSFYFWRVRDFQRKVLESVPVVLELAHLREVWQSGLFEKKILFYICRFRKFWSGRKFL